MAEHVELAYASTAHRAQGRSVDTAHAMVSPTTTREVLYVSATRGREHNRLYVDTHYDPDPQTSHDETIEPMTARQVLAGVLRNEGADVAAHEMIRRHQHEAEGMERLSAEYLTLATLAQAERWDALLVRSGLTDAELESVRASEAHGPLLASLREAEARGLDVEAAFPQLVARRSLADAADVAAVLHGRVDRWAQAAGGRRRMAGNLIAGLIPRAKVSPTPRWRRRWLSGTRPCKSVPSPWPPKRSRPEPAGCNDSGACRPILPDGPAGFVKSRRSRPTGTAGTSPSSTASGPSSDVGSTEQMSQRRRALAAAERAVAISHDAHREQASPAWEPQIEVVRGVEL